MGYRSDVMAVFYTYDPNEFPAIKLFIDENIPEWFRGDEYMDTFERGDTLRGVMFHISDVKWYPSYPDIQGFEQAMGVFEGLANKTDSQWAFEFVRLGEEVEDIEERQSHDANNLLYVERSIKCDF
jgi:hypothetical protein